MLLKFLLLINYKQYICIEIFSGLFLSAIRKFFKIFREILENKILFFQYLIFFSFPMFDIKSNQSKNYFTEQVKLNFIGTNVLIIREYFR